MEKLKRKLNPFLSDNFVFYTCLLSLLRGSLYIFKLVSGEFSIWGTIVVFFDLIYLPLALIFKRKFFPYFCYTYSIALVFILAFTDSFLYNNSTALFVMCIVIMIKPKLQKLAFASYFLAACIAFAMNEENLIHFFIHMTRSMWFVVIVNFVLQNEFSRKKLVLYEDEIKILNQLRNGKMYQKEVEGFSENTVYRKLKAARERNGNLTRDQLLKAFEKMYPEEKN